VDNSVCLLTFVLQVSSLKCFEFLKTWQIMATVAAAGGQPPEYPHQEEDEVNYNDEELAEAEEEEAQEGANLNQPQEGSQVRADRRPPAAEQQPQAQQPAPSSSPGGQTPGAQAPRPVSAPPPPPTCGHSSKGPAPAA
jgi:hypothetical protein